MDSDWANDQIRLSLIEPLKEHFRRHQIVAYVGGNSFVYYQPPNQNLGPDFYVVRGGMQSDQKKWVAWEEGGLLPTTVIEFLSPSTEARDRGEKFCIYRDIFRTEDYVLFNQESDSLESFVLQGEHYVAQPPGADGWFWLASLQLSLGWDGSNLRFRTPQGEILRMAREVAHAETRRADEEKRRADEEKRRADELERRAHALEQRLREAGLDLE